MFIYENNFKTFLVSGVTDAAFEILLDSIPQNVAALFSSGELGYANGTTRTVDKLLVLTLIPEGMANPTFEDVEIVTAYDATGNNIVVNRAQFGTTAKAWEASTPVGCYLDVNAVTQNENEEVQLGSLALAQNFHTVAIGSDCSASKEGGVAIGRQTYASAQFATAIGNSDASGDSSVALGSGAGATGGDSVAIGSGAEALAPEAISLGGAEASGEESIRIGTGFGDATGVESISVGFGDASAELSVSVGDGDADGLESVTVGTGSADSEESVNIGSGGCGGVFGVNIGSGGANEANAVNVGSGGVSYGQFGVAVGEGSVYSFAMADGTYGGHYAITIGGGNAQGDGPNDLPPEGSVLIGRTNSTGSQVVNVGGTAASLNAYSTNVNGAAAYASALTPAEGSVSVGADSDSSGAASVAVGATASVGAAHDNSVALGAGTSTTSADQASVGDRDLEVGTSTSARGIHLYSPDGTRYKLTVDNTGAISATADPIV